MPFYALLADVQGLEAVEEAGNENKSSFDLFA